MSNQLDAYSWIEPRPPVPPVPPAVAAERGRQELFKGEAHVSNDRHIPGYQRLHGVAPGEMCTLDGRGFCIIPGLHCPHDVGDDPGHIYTLEEAVTITGAPSEDRGGPKSLSQGNDFGRAR